MYEVHTMNWMAICDLYCLFQEITILFPILSRLPPYRGRHGTGTLSRIIFSPRLFLSPGFYYESWPPSRVSATGTAGALGPCPGCRPLLPYPTGNKFSFFEHFIFLQMSFLLRNCMPEFVFIKNYLRHEWSEHFLTHNLVVKLSCQFIMCFTSLKKKSKGTFKNIGFQPSSV